MVDLASNLVKDPKLVYLGSFEMYWQQIYRGQHNITKQLDDGLIPNKEVVKLFNY